MPDAPRRELAEAARLDSRARTILDGLPDTAADELLTAWRAAVQRQEGEVDAAIDGSLSLLPSILRKRVLKILTRGRS